MFGLFSLYEAKKYKLKLLALAGVTMVFVGLFWLGPFVDLMSILITGHNLNSIYLYGILSYVWIGPATCIAFYLGTELVLPKKKWYILSFYIVIGIIFEFFLFFDTKNVFIFSLNNPGEEIIDSNFNRTHICFYIIVVDLISILILLGLGCLIKAIQSEGIVRKKFLYLSIGYNIFFICATFDALFAPGPVLFIGRLIMMTFSVWMYLGLREEPEEKVKLKPKKEVKIRGDLFRIAKTRLGEITEEEVSISKEKKICLVCKGKVGRYMFMCPECETFYCEKCAHALETLENACWACNTPIDEEKPVKIYKKEVEDLEIEISEKSQKKPKVDKKSSKK